MSLLIIMFLNENTLKQLETNVVTVKFQFKVLIRKYHIRMLFLFCIKSHILNCNHKSVLITFVMLSCVSFGECRQQKKLN